MGQRTSRRQIQQVEKTQPASTLQKYFSPHVVFYGLLLVGFTFALYSPVRNHDFLNYDDDIYVYQNSHVKEGLSWRTIRWSLTSTEQANWHPMTWLSHALDCQLFGINDPGYHHLTNVFTHALNALLLFLLLQWATGALERSLMAAALFAWHPFNVQTVAWVAERKNVLSTLFFFGASAAYGWYARRPEFRRMLAVIFVFILALASKPMAVTFPCVLLLLDYWPLRRIAGWIEPSAEFPVPQQSVRRLLIEKVPLLALSVASSAITIWAQKKGEALKSLQVFPFSARFGNAIYSYLLYFRKTFWPAGFGVYYPHPGTSLALWKPVLAGFLLLAISVVAWQQRRPRPYLIVGWLWFLGTLLPMIGIVQVGDQALADRYTYIPMIGLFLMTVWGIADFLDAHAIGKAQRWAIAVLVLGTLSVITSRQISYWQNSVSLWSHTVQVTPENALAEQQLSTALVESGNKDEAMPHLLKVVQLNPQDLPTHVNIGVYYAAHGRTQDAADEFHKVIALTDHQNLNSEEREYRASSELDLGFAYAQTRDYPSALSSFHEALLGDQVMVDQTIEHLKGTVSSAPSQGGYIWLALLLHATEKDAEAASMLIEAAKANPDYSDVKELLNYMVQK